MNWLELHIDTVNAGLDEVVALLSAHGIDGVVIDDEADFQDFLENNPQYWDYVDEDLEKAMQGKSRVTFYLTADDEGFAKLGEVRIALQELKEARTDCGTLLMTMNNLQESDWESTGSSTTSLWRSASGCWSSPSGNRKMRWARRNTPAACPSFWNRG